ncbi:MAG: DUF2505 domain-containing protein [Micropruina sp.]|nr:MAG: DUF2505 domain-containing protein [Micropruina sp.]
MQITATNDFAADVESVHAMLTDEDFLAQVCVASGAARHRVAANADRAAIERDLPSPSSVKRFVGETLTTLEVMEWSPTSPDGSRMATLTGSVQGMPVSMNANVTLRPGGRGAVLRYDGTVEVHIPFLGKRLEEQAAPAMLEAIDVQQRVGDEWLAR